jgi:glycosyl transferase family 87
MRRRPNPVWLGLGIVGWAGLAWLAIRMFSTTPRTAGFDLELLLQAGREVAAGRSPYDPSMLTGGAPGATDLFYSYPPPVAQAMSLFAGLPSAVMFAGLWVLAVGGLAFGAALVSRRLDQDRPVASVVVPTLAVAPLFLPFGVALLFGNLDALFPFAYALVLVAAVVPTPRAGLAGGVALAAATIAKIHPAGLGPWFVGRLVRERASGEPVSSLRVILAAAVTVAAVIALSLLTGGADLWRDYVPVAGAASNARLLDPRNVGPAAQLALLVGGDEALVRTLHLPVAVGAVAASFLTGCAVRDRLTGISIAAIASLVILPITWYHYPSALIPFAVAAVVRARGTAGASRTTTMIAAAAVMATVSIAWVPALWLAVGLGLAGVAASTDVRKSPTT